MNRQAPIDAGPTRRTMSNRDKGLLLGSLALLLGGLVFLIVSLVGSDSSDTKIATGTTTVSATPLARTDSASSSVNVAASTSPVCNAATESPAVCPSRKRTPSGSQPKVRAR